MFTNSSELGKIENFWPLITNFDEFCQFYNALNSLVWRLHVQRVNAFAHIHKTQCFPGSLFDDYSNAQFSSRLSDWGEIYVSTWLHSKEMSQTAWSRGKDCRNSTLCIVQGSVADDYSSAQFSHETKQPQGHSLTSNQSGPLPCSSSLTTNSKQSTLTTRSKQLQTPWNPSDLILLELTKLPSGHDSMPAAVG